MAHTDDWIGFHKLDWDAILKTRKHKKLLLDEKKTFLDNISIVDQFRGKLSMAKKTYCKNLLLDKNAFLYNISIVKQFRSKISVPKIYCLAEIVIFE